MAFRRLRSDPALPPATIGAEYALLHPRASVFPAAKPRVKIRASQSPVTAVLEAVLE